MKHLKHILFIALLAVSPFLYANEIININSADKAALMEIKGVGEKRAEAIIAWREQNGPFKSVDELASVTGIGQTIVDENRASLTAE